MHSSENSYMTRGRGWAVYRSGNTQLVCLHASESPVYSLVANLFICSTTDSVHDISYYLRIIHIIHQEVVEPKSGFLYCSSFYAEMHMSSVPGWAILLFLKACLAEDFPGKKSPVQSCDSSHSSQHWQRIKTEHGGSSWGVIVLWYTVRETSRGEKKTPLS